MMWEHLALGCIPVLFHPLTFDRSGCDAGPIRKKKMTENRKKRNLALSFDERDTSDPSANEREHNHLGCTRQLGRVRIVARGA